MSTSRTSMQSEMDKSSDSSLLPDGTMVKARIFPDADEPRELWTTGELRSLWVTTRWGSWMRHEVNGEIVDPSTIEAI